jgi:hypothetical protein
VLAFKFLMTNEKEEEWQKLCELIANELDPHRMSQLVDQLIKELDAHRQARRIPAITDK